MKNVLILLFTVLLLSPVLKAQTTNEAITYMNSLTSQYSEIKDETWSYIRAVAHNKGAKKIEKRRIDLSSSIYSMKAQVKKTKPFYSTTYLRDSIVSYLDVSYKVINQDYAKIVDMEAVAEESYDLMEAYFLAKERANKKLDEAFDRLKVAQDKFAEEFNIKMQEAELDKKDKKIKHASKVFDYYNKLYLAFFKPYKQEMYLIEAQKKGDLNAMEQNKSQLIEFATEGKLKFNRYGSFEGDPSMKEMGIKLMNFYLSEAKKYDKIMNFDLIKERYETTVKTFESKPKKKRTQQDVDTYNKMIKEYNEAINDYNSINTTLAEQRADLINAWNKTSNKFTDRHVD